MPPQASARLAAVLGDHGVETPLAGVLDKAGASPAATIPKDWGVGGLKHLFPTE